MSTATGWRQRRADERGFLVSVLRIAAHDGHEPHAREARLRIRSTRSTCGSQSVPRVDTNVITRAPRCLRADRHDPAPRAARRPGALPAFLLHGSFWQTFASPSLSPSGASEPRKPAAACPTSGPLRPLPWFGSVCGEQQHAEPHQEQDARRPRRTCSPARGTSGRRAGSGCVRSRSASRSPTREVLEAVPVLAARSRGVRLGAARPAAAASRSRTRKGPCSSAHRSAAGSTIITPRSETSGRPRSRSRSRAACGCPRRPARRSRRSR